MKDKMKIDEILKDPEKSKLAKKVLYGLMGLLVLVDVFITPHHPYFPWDKMPGFNALYGFSAAAVIIFLAGAVGKLVMKGEDYYDD